MSCKLVAHSVTLDYGPTSRSQQNWPDINNKLALDNALLYAINNKVTKDRGKGFKRHLNKQLKVGMTRGPWHEPNEFSLIHANKKYCRLGQGI